jgi:hypothetical protein
MPLDAKRFGWTTDFPEGLQVLGEIALIFSALFLYRSYTDNTFVSPLVRVQEDRQQEVVSTGVRIRETSDVPGRVSPVHRCAAFDGVCIWLETPQSLSSWGRPVYPERNKLATSLRELYD